MPKLSKNANDPVLVSLGSAIRRIRLSKGISQEKLALMAEIDRSFVGQIERGGSNIALRTLVRLTRALDVSISKLMEEACL